MPDGFKDQATGFEFNRLGVRVPAVLISPWIPEGTVVSPLNSAGQIEQERIFEHASIPATVTQKFIGTWDKRSPREKAANTFLDVLSLSTPRTDSLIFNVGGSSSSSRALDVGARSSGIPIPEPLASSMNRNRPISGLLKDQIEHLHKAELTLPADQQTGIDIHTITTEAQASNYIQQITVRLQVRVATGGAQ
jgi:phospholipase C